MAKARSLVDEVKSSLPSGRGPLTWYDRLSPEMRDECDKIKAAFRAGEMGTKTGLGFTLARVLKSRGIDIGHSGVISWLERP